MDQLAPACRQRAVCAARTRHATPRRLLLAALVCLAFAACVKPPDAVPRDAQSVIDRTVPDQGRVIPGDSPRRAGQTLRASWSIEIDLSWEAYAGWVVKQLPEFRLQASEPGTLRFSRPLAGDVYYVTLRRMAGPGALRVEATFQADPF